MAKGPQLVNDIHSYKVLPHRYASNLNDALKIISKGKEYSYKTKRARLLSEFIEFCFNEDLVIKNGTDVALCFSAWQEEHFSGSKEINAETLISYSRVLWSTLSKLCHISVLGLPETNSIPPPRRLSTIVYSDTDTSKTKILGGFDLTKSQSDQSLTLTLEEDVDTFIKNLINKMRKHRDVIYKISKKYLADATNRYEFAQNVTKEISSEYFKDNLKLQHPKQKAIDSGQYLSLFSKYLRDGECGYSNLIAYINHCHHGLITRHFPGGNNHLYRFTNNQYELREHFGLSSLSAVAASNIIIVESGINVDSLRKLSLTAQGTMTNFFEPKTNGFEISYRKSRARAHKSRNLKHLNADDSYIESAFDYLALATSHHRTMIKGKLASRLFIHDSAQKTGLPIVMSDFPLKHGFKRLLVAARDLLTKDPDWCADVTIQCIDEVLAHNPHAKALRATESIIRWFDSGGNPAVAAKYLGNTETVAIKNYLPKELQLAVYNQRIRRFQNVLIASATNRKDYQIKALDLKDEKELKEYLLKLDKRVPHWRTVVKELSKDSSTRMNRSKKVTLNICPENVAVMKACYVKQTERDIKNIKIEDCIKDLSHVYLGLITYLKKNPDRRLNRTILKGEKLYDSNTNNYLQVQIIKQED
ncbi:hypothetical protein A9Q74_08810 [Colwellia sp. 39_35_sub15_T18]|nr:hypothetical protein A9Q74_08810 [Colwellia sp. 39_35_sub15_T18]